MTDSQQTVTNGGGRLTGLLPRLIELLVIVVGFIVLALFFQGRFGESEVSKVKEIQRDLINFYREGGIATIVASINVETDIQIGHVDYNQGLTVQRVAEDILRGNPLTKEPRRTRIQIWGEKSPNIIEKRILNLEIGLFETDVKDADLRIIDLAKGIPLPQDRWVYKVESISIPSEPSAHLNNHIDFKVGKLSIALQDENCNTDGKFALGVEYSQPEKSLRPVHIVYIDPRDFGENKLIQVTMRATERWCVGPRRFIRTSRWFKGDEETGLKIDRSEDCKTITIVSEKEITTPGFQFVYEVEMDDDLQLKEMVAYIRKKVEKQE